jgi:hypothetical protein
MGFESPGQPILSDQLNPSVEVASSIGRPSGTVGWPWNSRPLSTGSSAHSQPSASPSPAEPRRHGSSPTHGNDSEDDHSATSPHRRPTSPAAGKSASTYHTTSTVTPSSRPGSGTLQGPDRPTAAESRYRLGQQPHEHTTHYQQRGPRVGSPFARFDSEATGPLPLRSTRARRRKPDMEAGRSGTSPTASPPSTPGWPGPLANRAHRRIISTPSGY